MHVRAAVRRARRASKPRRGQRENAWCEATACSPLLAQEVEGEVAQHRQVLAAVADTHPALILAEGDSEDPMGPVLAPPLVADRVPERGGLARPAEQLRCSAPGWGTGRLHLDRRSFPAGCPKRAARVRVRATMWPRRAAYSATASREQAACCRRRGNNRSPDGRPVARRADADAGSETRPVTGVQGFDAIALGWDTASAGGLDSLCYATFVRMKRAGWCLVASQ